MYFIKNILSELSDNSPWACDGGWILKKKMAVDDETQAFEQLASLKISDGASKKENINLVSIGHVGMDNQANFT